MKEFDRLVQVVKKLRKDCPWDRKQTHASLKPYMREEMREAIEAIDENDPEKLAEELGDQLLHILMHAEISRKFTIKDIIKHITQKMIRRHPHVFGGYISSPTVREVLQNWEKIKQIEDKACQSGVKLKELTHKDIHKVWREKKSETGK